MDVLRKDLVLEDLMAGVLTLYYSILTTDTSFQINLSGPVIEGDLAAARAAILERVDSEYVLREVIANDIFTGSN